MNMQRLISMAIAVFIFASAIVYLAVSKSVDVDGQEFKLKTLLLQVKANAWGAKTLLDAGKKNYHPQSGTPNYLNALHYLYKSANEGIRGRVDCNRKFAATTQRFAGSQ